jgi:hypothetical protein
MYDLPEMVTICERDFNVRNGGDYRVMLDVIAALTDVNMSERSRVIAALIIFYPEYDEITDFEAASRELMRFLNCGEENSDEHCGKLIDWEQDFPLIVAPINRIMSGEIRSFEYLHWWTFLSAFYEIGECTLSHVVDIRRKKQKGKKLEKWEREFYSQNKRIIDFKKRVSDEDKRLIEEIMNGG